MTVTRIEGDVYINGNLQAKSMSIPPSSVGDDTIDPGADLDPNKLQHQHRYVYAQPSGSAAAAETKVQHVVYGATGSVIAFEAGSVTVCTGDATITVDLHTNGASILTTPIILDLNNSARVAEAGVIDSAALVDGDVLEVVVTVNAGTGSLGNGVFASLVVHEKAQ